MRPRLTDPSRRVLLAALAAAGFAQAAGAVIAAAGLGAGVEAAVLTPRLVAAIAVGALVLAAAMFAERCIGEKLAQSLVHDTRCALFESTLARAADMRLSHAVLPFIGDLAAVRNWAARGPVRLLTAAIAGTAATVMFAVQLPALAGALLPALAGTLAGLLMMAPLRRVIAEQRQCRGAVGDHVIRSVRQQRRSGPLSSESPTAELVARSRRLGISARRRAELVGVIEASAVIGSGLAALALLMLARAADQPPAGGVVGGLALLGFIGGRQLEAARALHALAGGSVALAKIEHRLASTAVGLQEGE